MFSARADATRMLSEQFTRDSHDVVDVLLHTVCGHNSNSTIDVMATYPRTATATASELLNHDTKATEPLTFIVLPES